MERNEALDLVKSHVKKENLLKHILAVEAIMKRVARELNEDEEEWGLVGLLHDVDYEETAETPERHTLVAEDILKGKVDETTIDVIKAHNFDYTGVEPKTDVAKALIAADAVSGLVVAAALVMPSKKLADVKPESLVKKFKQKDFARNCDRGRILFCEKIGIERDDFLALALEALQGISDKLGL